MVSIIRITGGSVKGRNLISPKGAKTRPASGALRESLFNIIRDNIQGARCVDLFAGVGTIGLEALSRGASGCVFIEKDRGAARILRRNIDLCGFRSVAEVYTGDAITLLSRLEKKGEHFTFVFVDPPYHAGLLTKTLKKLGVSSVVAPGGIVVVQRSSREEVPLVVGRLKLEREVRFGETILSFYSVTEEGSR